MDKPEADKPKFGFGARLKEARKMAGMSGAKLGLGLKEGGGDLSRQSISDWEWERHYPKVDQLKVICERLGVNAHKLIFGSERGAAVSPAVAKMADDVARLSDEDRAAFLAHLMKPTGQTDEDVENEIPITKTLKPKNPHK